MLFTLLVFAFVTFVTYECVKTFRRYRRRDSFHMNHWVGVFGLFLIAIGLLTR